MRNSNSGREKQADYGQKSHSIWKFQKMKFNDETLAFKRNLKKCPLQVFLL